MVKFEHSIFALPFALTGMMWAAGGWPGWRPFLLIVGAMVSCRTAAMAYNRIADKDIDALNPRTKYRAIPAGLLSFGKAQGYFFASSAIFLVCASLLNRTCLYLSPVALGTVLTYSLTKRVTWLCHLLLGFSLGIAPAASWIGVRGTLDPPILPLVLAVMCWVAGFDVIYSLQDEEFDRQHGLHSIPQRFGKVRGLLISRVLHVIAFVSLIVAGMLVHAGPLYYVGAVLAGLLLAYEQSLVKADDLSRVDMAFFTLNGFVSLGVFVFALLDQVLTRKP